MVLGLWFPTEMRSPMGILSASLVSLFLFLVSQLLLALVPQLFPWLSLVAMLPVSALVLVATIGFGSFSKRIIGVKQSAPAMVAFQLLFLWGVCIAKIREAVPSLLDAIIIVERTLLLFGLYRALHRSLGLDIARFVKPVSMIQSPLCCFWKLHRYSVHPLSEFVRNCDQKNQRLFMMLLVGFIIAEASHTMSSTQYIAKSLRKHKVGIEVMFLMWNIYCICANIKTCEWINWKQYPEFQLVIQSQPGNLSELKFLNPYNKGILSNIRDFLNPSEYSLHLCDVLS